jgi:hypothetical protein
MQHSYRQVKSEAVGIRGGPRGVALFMAGWQVESSRYPAGPQHAFLTCTVLDLSGGGGREVVGGGGVVCLLASSMLGRTATDPVKGGGGEAGTRSWGCLPVLRLFLPQAWGERRNEGLAGRVPSLEYGSELLPP